MKASPTSQLLRPVASQLPSVASQSPSVASELVAFAVSDASPVQVPVASASPRSVLAPALSVARHSSQASKVVRIAERYRDAGSVSGSGLASRAHATPTGSVH